MASKLIIIRWIRIGSHEKSCIGFNYRQFSTNIKMDCRMDVHTSSLWVDTKLMEIIIIKILLMIWIAVFTYLSEDSNKYFTKLVFHFVYAPGVRINIRGKIHRYETFAFLISSMFFSIWKKSSKAWWLFSWSLLSRKCLNVYGRFLIVLVGLSLTYWLRYINKLELIARLIGTR